MTGVPVPRGAAPDVGHAVKKVVIYDPHELTRRGLRAVIDVEPDLHVTADVGSAVEAALAARRSAADVFIMTCTASPLDTVSTILSDHLHPGRRPLVMALADSWTCEQAVGALRRGVRGLGVKTDNVRVLVEAVRAVAGGQPFVTPSVVEELLSRLVEHTPTVDEVHTLGLASLTTREREVLRLLAAGRSTGQIAQALSISKPTVKSHVSHVLQKLGVQDRVQAVLLAHRAGLGTG